MNDFIINWNVDPEIFKITGLFSLKYYSVLITIGLVIGYFMVRYIYIKEQNSIQCLEQIAIHIFLGMILGGRLGHCLFYDPEYYLHNLIEIFIPIKKIGDAYRFVGYQGMASHGGTLGVIFSIWLYCKKSKTNFLWLVDRLAVATAISVAFIRFGNFMNSEKATNGAWGVVFQKHDLIPRHPTQLYEAFSYIFISFILMLIYKKKVNRPNGLLFGVFLSLLFSARFMIEFFKENQVSFENGMILNMGQILSIPFIIVGLILIVKKEEHFKAYK